MLLTEMLNSLKGRKFVRVIDHNGNLVVAGSPECMLYAIKTFDVLLDVRDLKVSHTNLQVGLKGTLLATDIIMTDEIEI